MALKNLSTVDLQKELERRQKSGRKLESRRAKLVQEIAEIDAELGALGIAPGAAPAAGRRSGGKRTRAKNAVSLPDAIASAMDIGAEASPSEMSARSPSRPTPPPRHHSDPWPTTGTWTSPFSSRPPRPTASAP